MKVNYLSGSRGIPKEPRGSSTYNSTELKNHLSLSIGRHRLGKHPCRCPGMAQGQRILYALIVHVTVTMSVSLQGTIFYACKLNNSGLFQGANPFISFTRMRLP